MASRTVEVREKARENKNATRRVAFESEPGSGLPAALGGGGDSFAFQTTNLTSALLDFVVLFAHSCFNLRTMTATARRTMRSGLRPFNSFLLASALALGGSGAVPLTAADTSPSSSSKAKSGKKADPLAMIRLHVEVTDDGNAPKVEVIRRLPQTFPIMKQPFLDERDVARAYLVETPDGGFMIQIETTSHGKQALEMATVTSNGRHLVIFSQWNVDGSDKPEERWIAAPLIRGPLHHGSIIFSADCTREEAHRIVDGLNAVAVQLKNQPKSKSGSSSSSSSSTTKADQSKPPSSPNSSARDLIDKNQR